METRDILAFALHLSNESEQMVTALLEGATLDPDALDMHRSNLQLLISELNNKL